MKTFKDNTGHEWSLAITVGVVRRIKDKVDLLKLVENKFAGLDELLKDPFALVGLLYLLLEPQVKEQGLNEDTFPDRFGGEELYAGTQAFMSEYADFFPNPKIRDSLKSMFQKALSASQIIAEEIETEVNKVTPEQLVESLKSQLGNTQASLESTPTITP